MVEIYLWAEKYYPVPDEIRTRMDVFKKDKKKAIRKFKDELEKRFKS